MKVLFIDSKLKILFTINRLQALPRQQIFLCGILLVLPLERIPSLDIAGTTVRLSQIIAILLIATSLKLLWNKKGELLKLPWVFLVSFNLLALISSLLSLQPDEALKTTAFIWFVSLIAFLVSQVFDKKYLPYYLVAGGIGVVLSCMFGIYQFFGDLAGLSPWITGLREQYMKGGIFAFPRIQSTGLEPLYFSNYLLIPLALSLVGQVFLSKRLWPLTMLISTLIILGLSRGAMVAAGIIVFIIAVCGAIKKRWRPGALTIATIIGAIAISLLLVGFASFVSNQNNANKKTNAKKNVEEFTDQAINVNQGESVEGRALTRKLAAKAAAENPILGIGAGNFGYYANQQRPDKFTSPDTIVNNETLEIGAEQGLAGLALIMLFGWSLIKSAIKYVFSGADRSLRLTALGLLVGLVGIVLQYQLFSTLYITHIWVYIGLLAGIVLTNPKVKPAK